MTHANAPLTPEGRRRLAHLVVEDLSCTVLGWLVFQGGVFVGMVGVGWLLWGTKGSVGSGG